MQGMGDNRRWWTLGVLCLSLLIVGIDTSILNVALPTLVREVGASTSELQWIVDAYVVVFAGLLLMMGSVADRFGRKRVLTIGLLVFGAASAGAALSDSSTPLIICRAVMGIGAAMIMPATLSILANVFTDARERRRAIAYWSMMNAAATTLGPLTGGLLLRRFWWGSVFLVNVPMVLLALALGRWLVPESRNPEAARLDVAGAGLSTAGLSVLLWAIISGPDSGWTSAAVLGAFAMTIVLLALFVVWELRTPDPMLDVRSFADRRLSAAAGCVTIAMVALAGTMFLMPQLLQFVKGYSPLSSGMHVALPLLTVNFLIMPLSPRLTERFGPKRMVTLGLMSAACGLVAISFTKPETGYPNLLLGLLLMGTGFSLFLPAATDAIMSTLPPTKAGSGSAINQTSRTVGQAIGVAISGSLAAVGFRATLNQSAADPVIPANAIEGARESIAGSYRIATELSGPAREAFVKLADLAFVNGIRVSVLAGAVTAVVGAAFAAWALPGSVPAQEFNPSELAPTEMVVDSDEIAAEH